MPDMEERKQFNYLEVLRNPPSKKTFYYLSAFTAIVAIVLGLFAIRPTILTITKINKEIKEKTRISEALDDKIDALTQLDQQYSEYEDKLEALQLIFPTSGNFSLFMSNIEAVVARNGFVLNGLSFSEYDDELYDISSSVLSPWAVQLNVAGPANNLDNLFNDLEEMPMYPVIDRFNYGQTDEEELRSFSISMRIYHIENNNFYTNQNESD
jgi:hypothetical protein